MPRKLLIHFLINEPVFYYSQLIAGLKIIS